MRSLRLRVSQVHDGTLHLPQVVGVKVADLILGLYLEKQLRVLGQGIRSPVPLGGRCAGRQKQQQEQIELFAHRSAMLQFYHVGSFARIGFGRMRQFLVSVRDCRAGRAGSLSIPTANPISGGTIRRILEQPAERERPFPRNSIDKNELVFSTGRR